MKNFQRFLLSALILLLVVTGAVASTAPQTMYISCNNPKPSPQTNLQRSVGDSGTWTFHIVLEDGAHFVKGPYWHFPGKGGNDPDWGLWIGGNDGDKSLGWSSPQQYGLYGVTVDGEIGCGNGNGGKPIKFEAGWGAGVSAT